MSRVTGRDVGLKHALARKTYIVFVARERDMNALRRKERTNWTVPSPARPGDRVLVYKPGEGSGFLGGTKRPPYKAFVAAAVVHGEPKPRRERGTYNAPIDEIAMFPNPVEHRVIADAFPEWNWLRNMRGMLGAEVPESIDDELFSLLDRLAFRRPASKTKPSRQKRS